MALFGKTLSDYIQFQKVLLILTAAVGLIRFGLTFAGTPDPVVNWFSVTALLLFGIVYYPIQVHRKGFGGYKHVWMLIVIQTSVAQVIIGAGILMSGATGIDSIFSEGAASGYLPHALSHLIGGPTVFAGIFWVLSVPILLVTKRFMKPTEAL